MSAIRYEQLEDDIVARLAPLATLLVDLEAMPESEAEFSEVFDKSRITVMYQNSDYGGSTSGYVPSMALATVQVDEYAEVHVVLRARTLRGSGSDLGIYEMLERTARLLTSYRPTGWERMHPRKTMYVGNNGTVFTYDMVYAVRRVATLPLLDDEGTVYPVITSIETNIAPTGA